MTHFEKHSEDELRRVRERQQQEIEDGPMGPEYVVHTRATDFSFWVRVGYLLDKYKLLVYLVFMALIALGFDFKTPAQNNKMLNTRIDSLVNARRQDAEKAQRIEQKLDILITLKCLEPRTEGSTRDLRLVRLNCDDFVQPQLGTTP
jgi:hypothetical protein